MKSSFNFLYNFVVVDPNHIKRIQSHRLCRALTRVGIMQFAKNTVPQIMQGFESC